MIDESNATGAALPPQNIEAEESVLGAMMVSETALDAVNDARLEPDDFYRPRHRTIFQAIRTLDGRGEPIDALTVAELLRTEGRLEEIGGSELIYGLASETAVPGNAGHYAQIVRQNALLRRLLGAAQKIQTSIHGRDAEPRELVEQAESLLFNVARDDQASEFSSLGDILVHETERLEKLAMGESEMTGTVSGFRRLDEMTGGFQPGNLIVIAARPGDGQVLARLQHRRERRLEGEEARRLLLARDVGDRARPSLHRLAGADPLRQAAQGPGRQGLAEGAQGLQRADRGAAVDRRLLRSQPDGPARQVAPPALELRRPRADHRRLHPADACGGHPRRPASSRSAR